MYKAVLFDFFDVIHLDHQKAWLQKNGFKRRGGFAEASDLLDRGAITYQEYLTRFAVLSDRSAVQVRREYSELAQLDEAVVPLIADLKQRLKTGLISNASGDELRPIMDQYNLASLFDEIIVSSEVRLAKPDPDIFRLALKQLDTLPGEAVFIDDNAINVRSAMSLGIKGIVYTDAAALRESLAALRIILPN